MKSFSPRPIGMISEVPDTMSYITNTVLILLLSSSGIALYEIFSSEPGTKVAALHALGIGISKYLSSP